MAYPMIYGEPGQYVSPEAVTLYNDAHRPISFLKSSLVYRRKEENRMRATLAAIYCSRMWNKIFDQMADRQLQLLRQEAS